MNGLNSPAMTILNNALAAIEAIRSATPELFDLEEKLGVTQTVIKEREAVIYAEVASETVSGGTGKPDKPKFSNEDGRKAEAASRVAKDEDLIGLKRELVEQRKALAIKRADLEAKRQQAGIWKAYLSGTNLLADLQSGATFSGGELGAFTGDGSEVPDIAPAVEGSSVAAASIARADDDIPF